MHQTLFFIPYELFGFPIFGFGILMILWLLGVAAWSFWYWRFAFTKSSSEYWTNLLLFLFGGGVLCFVLPKTGKLAGIPVQSYGTMMLLGILLSYGLAAFRAKRFGFTAENIFSVSCFMCLFGLLGARTFFVIEYWSDFQSPTLAETVGKIVNIPSGGLVVYGSIIGGILGGGIYMFLRKLSVLRMMDLLAPSFMLGLALGRIGCFLNGCCFGGVCDPAHEFWGVHFPAGSPPWNRQFDEKMVGLDSNGFYYGMRLYDDFTQTPQTSIVEVQPGSLAEKTGFCVGDRIRSLNGRENPSQIQVVDFLIWGVREHGKFTMELDRNGQILEKSCVTTSMPGPVSLPVYPTQLYSSGSAALICVILLIYSWFRKNPEGLGMKCDGEVFLLFLTIYPINRFILEIIRTDEANALGTSFTISQNISLLLLTIAGISWIYLLTHKRKIVE